MAHSTLQTNFASKTAFAPEQSIQQNRTPTTVWTRGNRSARTQLQRLRDGHSATKVNRLGTALMRLETADHSSQAPQTAAPTDPQTNEHPADRRLFPRHQLSYTVCVQPDDHSRSVELASDGSQGVFRGEMIDLSLNGIALMLPKPLAPSRSIRLQLRNPVSMQELKIKAQVVRCLPSKSQAWKVVCIFDQHLSVEQLIQFTGNALVQK